MHNPGRSAACNGRRRQLSGAGSTFDAPFFTAAFTAYQQAHPSVAVSYAVGSGAGITRFTGGQVNFGALNPGAGLPDAYINVIHRSDGSGTRFMGAGAPAPGI